MYCTSLFTSCLYCLIWLFLSIYHITKSIIYHVNAFFTLIIILLSSNHLSWNLSPTQAQGQPSQSLVLIFLEWVHVIVAKIMEDFGNWRKKKLQKQTWNLSNVSHNEDYLFFDFWEKLFWQKIENGGCFTHVFWTFF